MMSLLLKLIIFGCLFMSTSGQKKEREPTLSVKRVAADVPVYYEPPTYAVPKRVEYTVPEYVEYYEPPTANAVPKTVEYKVPEYVEYYEPPTANAVPKTVEYKVPEYVEYYEPPTANAVPKTVEYKVPEYVEYVEPPTANLIAYDVPQEVISYEEMIAYEPEVSYLVAETVAAPIEAYLIAERVAEPVVSYLIAETVVAPVEAYLIAESVAEPVVSYLIAETVAAPVVSYLIAESVAEPVVMYSELETVISAPVSTDAPVTLTDIDYMKELFKDFIANTDTMIRPVINQSKPIHVHTKFVPISILHFDTTEQKFSILAYFRVFWNDELITWKPKFYNGLYFMKVPTTDIWKPNLIIEKPFNGEGSVGNEDSDIAVISWLGDVQWVPDGTYSVVCDVNIQYYPFDEQVCTITYYMADEVVSTLELTHDAEVTTEELTENSAWIVTSLDVKTYIENDMYYVKVDFNLRRRPNYTAFTLIAPLMMLAFLNMCIFLVPADSGEKGGIAITIFLSYGIFISIISESLPNNSIQTSYFLIFITVLLVLSVLSVFYVIFQAKMCASASIKESLVKCFIPEFMQGKEKIGGAQRSMNQFVNASSAMKNNDVRMAWKLIFYKIDMAIFFTFLFIAVAATSTFFCLMLKKLTESTMDIIK